MGKLTSIDVAASHNCFAAISTFSRSRGAINLPLGPEDKWDSFMLLSAEHKNALSVDSAMLGVSQSLHFRKFFTSVMR